MKLRIARKIIKAVGTSREPAYTQHQIGRAFARIDRTASERESRRFAAWMSRLFWTAAIRGDERARDFLRRGFESTARPGETFEDRLAWMEFKMAREARP